MLCQKMCDVPFGMTAMLSVDGEELLPEQLTIASVTIPNSNRISVDFMSPRVDRMAFA
jgi:hypothetical protein